MDFDAALRTHVDELVAGDVRPRCPPPREGYVAYSGRFRSVEDVRNWRHPDRCRYLEALPSANGCCRLPPAFFTKSDETLRALAIILRFGITHVGPLAEHYARALEYLTTVRGGVDPGRYDHITPRYGYLTFALSEITEDDLRMLTRAKEDVTGSSNSFSVTVLVAGPVTRVQEHYLDRLRVAAIRTSVPEFPALGCSARDVPTHVFGHALSFVSTVRWVRRSVTGTCILHVTGGIDFAGRPALHALMELRNAIHQKNDVGMRVSVTLTGSHEGSSYSPDCVPLFDGADTDRMIMHYMCDTPTYQGAVVRMTFGSSFGPDDLDTKAVTGVWGGVATYNMT